MKKKLSTILAVILALTLLLGFAACSGGGDESSPEVKTPESSESAENLEPIKIGCIQDTSGGASIAGKPNEWGVQYAVDYINENGGINGRIR